MAGPARAIAATNRWMARSLPLAAFVLVAIVVLVRQTGVPKTDTIWAEDGTIFAGCAYDSPLPACLVEPYAGWFLAVPRVGAAIATTVPPGDLSLALGLISAVIAGLTGAAVGGAVRGATGSWLAGLLAAVTMVAVWQAGREISGNLTNLHWILLSGAVVVIVMWWVGAGVGPGGILLVGAAGLSSPFAVILPVLVAVGALGGRPGWRALFGVASAAALAQLAIVLASPRVPPGAEMGIAEAVRSFMRDVVARGGFGTVRAPPSWIIPVGAAAVCVLGAALALRQAPDRPADPGTRLQALRSVIAAAALSLIGIAIYAAAIVLQHTSNPRYGYVPSTLMTIGLIAGAALLAAAGRGDAAGSAIARTRPILDRVAVLAWPVVAILLVIGFGRSFFLESRASAGPNFPAAYAAAAPACASGASSIIVVTSPIGRDVWTVEIPCDRVGASGR